MGNGIFGKRPLYRLSKLHIKDDRSSFWVKLMVVTLISAGSGTAQYDDTPLRGGVKGHIGVVTTNSGPVMPYNFVAKVCGYKPP